MRPPRTIILGKISQIQYYDFSGRIQNTSHTPSRTLLYAYCVGITILYQHCRHLPYSQIIDLFVSKLVAKQFSPHGNLKQIVLIVSSSTIDQNLENRLEIDKKNRKQTRIFRDFCQFRVHIRDFCKFRVLFRVLCKFLVFCQWQMKSI